MTNPKGQFQIEQSAFGCGMSVAFALDLDPKRSLKPRTWRRLTVAEKMRTVGSDEAVAYRLQIGKEQWLIYRTLAEKGNRTFLGQNYADDFFLGKIDIEGNVEAILEIE